jgi:cell division protein FtsB
MGTQIVYGTRQVWDTEVENLCRVSAEATAKIMRVEIDKLRAENEHLKLELKYLHQTIMRDKALISEMARLLGLESVREALGDGDFVSH